MSTPTSSPLRPHPTSQGLPVSRSRDKIRADSATGWSPLRIQKRPSDSPASASAHPEGAHSPLAKQSSAPSAASPAGEETYRRTSSSFKHVKHNSLVSNSPFKQGNTPPLPQLGRQQAAKKAVGLGISRSPASPGGPTSSPRPSPRKTSGDRRRRDEENLDPAHEPAIKVVAADEHDAEDDGISSGDDEVPLATIERRRADFKRDAKRRQSAGLANLSSKSKVSNSPFLTRSSSSELDDVPASGRTSRAASAGAEEVERAEEGFDEPQDDLEPEEAEPEQPQHPTLFHPSPLESLSSTLSSSQPSSPSSSVLSAPSPPPAPPAELHPQTPATPSRPTHLQALPPVSPSPKSSLKSRRIKGPRSSSGSGSGVAGSGARPRRKTVTFREGAEVSVFERDQDPSVMSDSGDEYGNATDEDEDESYGEGSFELDHAQRGGYSDDDEQDSYYPGRDEARSATESFVSSLIEEDLFSPSSVGTPVFPAGMMAGFPASPLMTADPRDHQSAQHNSAPPHTELPHPEQDGHNIGMNDEVVVEERDGEIKAHQEGPLHDPFLVPSVSASAKKMGGLGLGRPSGEVPRRRVEVVEQKPEEQPAVALEEPSPPADESEEDISMLDDGDLSLALEGDESFLRDVLDEGDSVWEEEKTSEEVGIIEDGIVDHPLMGTRGLTLPAEMDDSVLLERPIEFEEPVAESPASQLAAPTSALETPWHLPSFESSASPLFPSAASPLSFMKDLPPTAPAADAAAPLIAQSEAVGPAAEPETAQVPSEQPLASSAANEFGSYKPSSSLERLRAEDGEDGNGSASGRSPRLTRESIRRRMDDKERERKEKEASKRPSSASEWRPIEGLGINMPSPTQPVRQRPMSVPEDPIVRAASPEKAHLDKDLPAPPPSATRPQPTSHAMSRPKAATSDMLPASIVTQRAAEDRPAVVRARSSTVSAHDLLSSESALDKLALGAVATAAVAPLGAETVKNGSEKEVKASRGSTPFHLERPLSSPVEEAGSHGRNAIPVSFLAADDKARKERELMPPPAVPKPASSPTPSNSSLRDREEAINARRREKREAESGRSGLPRPKGRGRRSLSTGDASPEGLQQAASESMKRRTLQAAGSRPQSTLDDVSILGNLTPFEDSLTNEFDRITEQRNRQYKLVERESVYIASDEKVKHDKKAGDLDRGKAWRSVKRPSDMNEYAEEIREIRAKEKPGKSHAKVFVKIIGITDIDVPIPDSTTSFVIVLNNGLHSVETQAYRFGQQVDIGQEFELLGLENLEFSLAVKIRKDQNILSRLKHLTPRPFIPPTSPVAAPSTPSKTSSFRKLISSPRKVKPAAAAVPAARPAPPPITDDLVRYLDASGQLAIVKVIFKEIAPKCNGQILNLHLPLTGRWNSDAVNSEAAARTGGDAKRPRTIGRMQLQVLMIDQIPGVPSEKLPQSLDDAVTGLRHVRWHKMDYFSGHLTQLGGDTSSWRRRQMRIVGGTLEATSDVTNKITARIDLSKMVAIRDNNAESTDRLDEEYSDPVERSFRLVFDNGDEIQFYADKDKDKEDWLHHLRELLGRVPSLPLWAELLWVRQHQEQSPPL